MYQIIPLLAATAQNSFPLNRVMYRYPHEGSTRYKFGFAAVKSDDETILVDAGIASDEEFSHISEETLKEITAMVDNRPFPEILSDAEINPDKVEKVILTHLHWDHAWNLDKLPNAKIYVQRKELGHAIAPYPYERVHFGYMGEGIYRTPPFLRVADRIVALDGETEIQPGIRVIPTPGHTFGSQSVLVDTVEGTYALVGDFCNLPVALEGEGYPPGLFCSNRDWYESLARIRKEKLAGIITFHDPNTYVRNYG
jgi:glyoxylase-like metal-dependent hydrolase (beta-lactamase superfamily II)